MAAEIVLSRMETRLQAEIATASSPMHAACKRAELAAYWARLGKFDDAKAELERLRLRSNSVPNACLSSWLHLLDGLIDYFSTMSNGVREKFQRSNALAKSSGSAQIYALSAAWLAQLDYLRLESRSMVNCLKIAFAASNDVDHATRYRASLVLAQSYHYAGRFDLARPWYDRARLHAVADGDDAALSALMHNMAWLRFNQSRTAIFPSQASNVTGNFGLIDADATLNYDLLIGSKSLSSMVPMLRAQILTELSNFGMALHIFETELKSALDQGMARLQADWLADQAWCRIRLGQIVEGRLDADFAATRVDALGYDDDQALSHRRIAQIYSYLGEKDLSLRHEVLSNDAWGKHVEKVEQLLTVLAEIEGSKGVNHQAYEVVRK